MRDLSCLTGKKILEVNAPELLFSNNLKTAKNEYRYLIRQWHPDFARSKIAPQVLSHVIKLFSLAKEKLSNGTWREPVEKIEKETPGLKKFLLTNGSIKSFEYKRNRSFELGSMYISDNAVLFEIDSEFEDLYRNGRRRIRSLTFQNENMACELSKNLPVIEDTYSTVDNFYLQISKTPDQFLLADVCDYLGGRVTPTEHVGWILNCLYNLCCYFQWAGITHNAINQETVFISPLRHSAMIIGGWWYSAKEGEKLNALPDTSINAIPPDVLDKKIADYRLDLELIKATGRSLLGDTDGIDLRFDENIPESIIDWLVIPASDDAILDYSTWKHEVLLLAFGTPRFVNMEIESCDFYQLKNKED